MWPAAISKWTSYVRCPLRLLVQAAELAAVHAIWHRVIRLPSDLVDVFDTSRQHRLKGWLGTSIGRDKEVRQAGSS